MAKLKVGDKAPLFTLVAQTGEKISLSDVAKKKKVVLYFYPKDNTPGCTKEACEFRDTSKKIANKEAVVIGTSPDSMESHQNFSKKYGLPFWLLSDNDKEVVKKYGVWVKKKRYGREYYGVARTTFIIGKNGKIERIFENVSPEGHSEEILESL